jgi:hypothetical protein
MLGDSSSMLSYSGGGGDTAYSGGDSSGKGSGSCPN